MTKEEFLKLMGKDSENEDKKLIEAIEKVFEEKDVEHSDDEEEALEHYGIEGQKWGVKNGPPYPLERQKGFHRISKKDKARILIDNLDDLSLQEIRDLVSRMELEEKLAAWANPPKQKGFASKMLETTGKTLLSVAVPAATTYAFKKIVEYAGGEEAVADMFPKKK